MFVFSSSISVDGNRNLLSFSVLDAFKIPGRVLSLPGGVLPDSNHDQRELDAR